MEKERIIIFLSKYDKNLNLIDNIINKLNDKLSKLPTEKTSMEIIESIGYWMHNLYCSYEDLFKLVASFFENNIHSNGFFHKKLLETMAITIQGIRPALISDDSYKYLDELRAFRHVFRHAYSYGLDDERVIFLLHRVIKQKDTIMHDLKAFRETINNDLNH